MDFLIGWMMRTYEIFEGEELVIAERIQQRRLQLLVHSCIYYYLNGNIVPDAMWDKWARELVQLQKSYPDIAEQVIWDDAFSDWDASTGAFLPIKDAWVVSKAKKLLNKKLTEKSKAKTKKRLF